MVLYIYNTLLNVIGIETDRNLCFIPHVCTLPHKHLAAGESLFGSLFSFSKIPESNSHYHVEKKVEQFKS